MYVKVSGKGQTRLCALFVFPSLNIVDFVNGFRATDIASTYIYSFSTLLFDSLKRYLLTNSVL